MAQSERTPGGRHPGNPQAKALAHPVRARIYAMLKEERLSPSAISRRVEGQTVGVVAYHVKRLRAAGLIEEAGTAPARGALEHFYKAVEGGDLAINVRLRQEKAAALLAQIRKLVEAAGEDEDGDVWTVVAHP